MRKTILRILCAGLSVFSVLLSGCSRDINYIVDNEEKVRGIVSYVDDKWIGIDINEDDELYSYGYIEVSRETKNKDGRKNVIIGDEIAVYYDGNVTEGDPPQIDSVYAILYIGPADRNPDLQEKVKK